MGAFGSNSFPNGVPWHPQGLILIAFVTILALKLAIHLNLLADILISPPGVHPEAMVSKNWSPNTPWVTI